MVRTEAGTDSSSVLMVTLRDLEPRKQEAEDSKSEVGGAEDLQPLQPYWLTGSVILVEGLLPSIAMARSMPCLSGTSNPSLVHALRGQGHGSLGPPNQATLCIV